MELSIIVPVYNVDAYLEKCLHSLVHQSLDSSKYEVIIVNDGSPDKSQEIIDRFAIEYPNVRAYQKENGGLSDARNYGIEKAKGKYLAFIDSDDYVREDMFELMLTKAYEEDFDMVVCDFIEIYDDHEVICSSQINHDIMNINELKKTMCNIYPSAWNKIYKRSLFANIRFKKGVWFEDVECLYRLLPLVTSIGTVKEPLNFYIQRQGSISKSKDERIFHCVENWNGIYEYYYENKEYWQLYSKELEYCYVRYLYATFIKASLKYDYTQYQKAVDVAIKEVKKHFKHYRSNRYFYTSLKGIYLVLFNRMIAKIMYYLKAQKG